MFISTESVLRALGQVLDGASVARKHIQPIDQMTVRGTEPAERLMLRILAALLKLLVAPALSIGVICAGRGNQRCGGRLPLLRDTPRPRQPQRANGYSANGYSANGYSATARRVRATISANGAMKHATANPGYPISRLPV